MEHFIQAKFEHGVFRPLNPVDLVDQSVVSLMVVTEDSPTTPLSETVARQRAALAAFLEEAKTLELPRHDDGLTNRDHDQIIYGP
jgi:predicted DNA-binding antitoxin AbrB/MazE fold protein